MWVRKTDEEIRSEKRVRENTSADHWRYFRNSLLFAVFTFIMVVLSDKLGCSRNLSANGLPWSDIRDNLGLYIFLMVIMLFLTYFFQAKYKIRFRDNDSTTHICTKCNAKKLDDGKYHCQCGGEFVHIDKMKWVED